MSLTQRKLVGTDALAVTVELLRLVRMSHPTAGVWEAADFEWWWRKPRSTDDIGQLFWFDGDQPVAAAIVTDWGGNIGLDVITRPHAAGDLVAEVFRQGVELAASLSDAIEVMVDDEDHRLLSLLTDSGFTRLPGAGTSAWMSADHRPPVSALADGYRLASRAELAARPHHYIDRNGPDVEERLQQTSMYQSDLDLAVLDSDDIVVGYGLFWFDPMTQVGFVEPMGVDVAHRRRGLARHLLTAGVQRLAGAGARSLKINFENDSPASSVLYIDVGFRAAMTTLLYVRHENLKPQEGSKFH